MKLVKNCCISSLSHSLCCLSVQFLRVRHWVQSYSYCTLLIEQHGFIRHLYADDTQVYGRCRPSAIQNLQHRLSACIDEVHSWMQSNWPQLKKGKEEHLYRAYTVYISKRSGMDHTVLPANTPCLPFLCTRSPDGATSNWGKRHLIAAYYSSIDPEGMKGWVGLVGWPIADGLPT